MREEQVDQRGSQVSELNGGHGDPTRLVLEEALKEVLVLVHKGRDLDMGLETDEMT